MGWEQALTTLVPKDQKVVNRDEFAGPKSPPWIAAVGVTDNGGHGGGGVDPQKTWDVYIPFDITGYVGSLLQTRSGYVWVNLDWGKLDGTDGAWTKILHIGEEILDPLVHPPEGNTVVSRASFTNAAQMLRDINTFLDQWSRKLSSQAKQVESGGDLQGQAAKTYQSLLENAGKRLGEFGGRLADPLLIDALAQSRDTLGNEVVGLLNQFIAWRGTPLHDPREAVHTALLGAGLKAEVDSSGGNNNWANVTTKWGGIWDESFKTGLDREAKNLWLNNYAWALDPLADFLMKATESAYGVTVNRISPVQMGQIAPTYKPPSSTGDGTGSGSNQNPFTGTDTGTGGSGGQGTGTGGTGDHGGNGDLPPGTGGTGTGGEHGKNGDGTNGDGSDGSDLDTGDGGETGTGGHGSQGGQSGQNGSTGHGTKDQTPPPIGPTTTQFGPGGIGSGSGGGRLGSKNPDPDGAGTSSIIGPDGNPVRYSDGEPVTVPNGSHINPDGTVVKPDGSPVTDKNGHHLTVPKDSVIRPNQAGGGSVFDPTTGGTSSVFTPDGQVARGPDGNPITVPDGSHINSDGTITRPDGSRVTGSDGNPLHVDPHAKLQHNTALRWPDGSTYHDGNNQQLYLPPGSGIGPGGQIVDPNHQSMFGPNGAMHVPDTPYAKNKLNSMAPFHSDAQGGVKLSSGEIGDPAKRGTTNSSALDDALEKQQKLKTETGPHTLGESGKNGQQQSAMPPPGMGGGAGADGKERQRTTWLAEDESTWGTDSGGFTAAIGR
ncbi:hypothetical protein ACFWY9_00745 [Amycolatopsis sp. NPDC059027]|uniref:hypothetical protein n=1 Tax=Amycolatopsis sp. NPDC059027 TaxID=3346709 RepID=UPI00367257D9